MARLAWVREQINAIEQARLARLEQAPARGPDAMVRLLARVVGVGVETADMLVQEVLSRNLRDRRAVARYAGVTGSPDESGAKRRERGLAKAGNARVRRGLMQLAWRFLRFQKESALAQWYYARTEGAAGMRKTTMIVALARKLLIALWRMVTTGEIPAGIALRTVAACSTRRENYQASSFGACRQAADHDPRWWRPEHSHGIDAVPRMGPPPRSLAVEANDCFMVSGLCRPNRIQGCGAPRASKRASLGSFILDQQERRRPREMNLDRGVPIQGCVKTLKSQQGGELVSLLPFPQS